MHDPEVMMAGHLADLFEKHGKGARLPVPAEAVLIRLARDFTRLRSQRIRGQHRRPMVDLLPAPLDAIIGALGESEAYLDRDELTLLRAARRVRGALPDPVAQVGRPESPAKYGAAYIGDRIIRAWKGAGAARVSHQTEGPAVRLVRDILAFIDGSAPQASSILKSLQRHPPAVSRGRTKPAPKS